MAQEAGDPEWRESEARVRSSFARQGLMATLGATLESIAPGIVEIALPPHAAISQQHGFVHAGAVTAIADSAAGYAALTLMPLGTGVLSAEFKINLLAPAMGERIIARGKVVTAGRTLTIAQSEVFAKSGGGGEADRPSHSHADGRGRPRRHQRLRAGSSSAVAAGHFGR